MNKSEFVDTVLTDVTEGYVLPTQPNKKRLDNIIGNSLRWFRQNDDDSHEFQYAVIKYSNFKTQLFKDKRQIKLPDNVISVIKLQDPGSILSFNSLGGFKGGDTSYNRAMMVAGNSDNMVYAVTSSMYDDFVKKNFQLRTTSFEFSEFSHMLTIKGRDPMGDMIAHLYTHICDEDIFNNDRFHRFVKGEIKKSFGNLYGLVKIKTIGGLEISASELKSEGNDEIKEVKDEIKEARSIAHISFS